MTQHSNKCPGYGAVPVSSGHSRGSQLFAAGSVTYCVMLTNCLKSEPQFLHLKNGYIHSNLKASKVLMCAKA